MSPVAACRFTPDGDGRCRLAPASAAGCHRVRSPRSARWPCLIVISRRHSSWGDTRWHAAGSPGTVRQNLTLPVLRRTIRDLLWAPGRGEASSWHGTAPSGPCRHPLARTGIIRHPTASRPGALWRAQRVCLGHCRRTPRRTTVPATGSLPVNEPATASRIGSHAQIRSVPKRAVSLGRGAQSRQTRDRTLPRRGRWRRAHRGSMASGYSCAQPCRISPSTW